MNDEDSMMALSTGKNADILVSCWNTRRSCSSVELYLHEKELLAARLPANRYKVSSCSCATYRRPPEIQNILRQTHPYWPG